MIITLENEAFTAEISSKGAELQNLIRKNDKMDVIWHGDKAVWGNHAPLLFPYVARCLGGYFMIEGKKCEYSRNHGFARDLEHKVVEQTTDSVVFELTHGEDTLYRFPYSFIFRTEYKLTDKGINWKIIVKNTGDKAFRFGTGTHAAFDFNGHKAEDFVVEFEKKTPLTAVVTTPECYLAADKDGKAPYTKSYGEKETGFVPVTSAGFGNGHLFLNNDSEWVGLKNIKNGSIIKITTKGFPYVMLWQNTAGDPQFVCIEPWHGLPDAENTDHLWQNKAGMNDLPAGGMFTCEQNIFVE